MFFCRASFALLFVFSILHIQPLRADLYDVVDLVRAGTPEADLLAYVRDSSDTYDLSAQDITFLNDIGVPDAVIIEMLSHPTTGASAVALARDDDPEVRNYNSLVTAPAPDDSDLSFFYEALAPYGNWIDVEGYGTCWQPYTTLVSEDWAPYRDSGHWIHPPESGWLWASDYSWGWAPFHYGRWTWMNDRRWLWVPDTVWAPAWVSWRGTPEYCGWAPLPPEAHWIPGVGFSYLGRRVGFDFDFGLGYWDYTFVPAADLGDRSYAGVFLAPELCEPVFARSALAAGITLSGPNLLDVGFDFNLINSRCRRPIQQPELRSLAISPGQPVRNGYFSDNQFFVYRPRIAPRVSLSATVAVDRARARLERVEGRAQIQRAENEIARRRPVAVRQLRALALTRHNQALATAHALALQEQSARRVQHQQTAASLPASRREETLAARTSAARTRTEAAAQRATGPAPSQRQEVSSPVPQERASRLLEQQRKAAEARRREQTEETARQQEMARERTARQQTPEREAAGPLPPERERAAPEAERERTTPAHSETEHR